MASLVAFKATAEDRFHSTSTPVLLHSESPSESKTSSQQGLDNLIDFREVPLDQYPEASTSKQPETPPPAAPTWLKQYAGTLFTFAASALLSSVLVLVKVLYDSFKVSGAQASFWRYAGPALPALPMLVYHEGFARWDRKGGQKVPIRPSVFSTVWPLGVESRWKTMLGLVMRGVVGSMAVICRFFSLQYLTLGDASVISYSSPILVTVLAHFFLGEKTGLVPIATAILSPVGVAVIARPPIFTGAASFDPQLLIGTGLALTAMCCTAVGTILARKVRKVHISLMMTVFGTIGMTQAVVFIYATGGTFALPYHSPIETWLTCGILVLSGLGQMAVIFGLKFEQAGPVALIRSCDMVFGFFFQFVFLGIAPTIYSAIGGSIIILGAFIITFRKYITTLHSEHKLRRSLWFLLK